MTPVAWAALAVAVVILAGVIFWGYAAAARTLYQRDRKVFGGQPNAAPEGGGPRGPTEDRLQESATPAEERREGR